MSPKTQIIVKLIDGIYDIYEGTSEMINKNDFF